MRMISALLTAMVAVLVVVACLLVVVLVLLVRLLGAMRERRGRRTEGKRWDVTKTGRHYEG